MLLRSAGCGARGNRRRGDSDGSGAFASARRRSWHPLAPDRTVGGSSGGSGRRACRRPGLWRIGYGYRRQHTHSRRVLWHRRPKADAWSREYGRCAAARANHWIMWDPWRGCERSGPAAQHSIRATANGRRCEVAAAIIVGYRPALCRRCRTARRRWLERALTLCESSAREIRSVSLPMPADRRRDPSFDLLRRFCRFSFLHVSRRASPAIRPPRCLLELASTLPGYRYRRALRHREQMRALTRRLCFPEVDFVLAPTLRSCRRARRRNDHGRGKELDFTLALIRYTFVFDHTGNPVVSLPVTEAAPESEQRPGRRRQEPRRRRRGLRRPFRRPSCAAALRSPPGEGPERDAACPQWRPLARIGTRDRELVFWVTGLEARRSTL